MNIRFGHSPDPDDAFMFYAIAHNKIDTKGFQIEHVVEDIESLNQRALKAELEVTAVSVHAYAYVHKDYAIMRSGASMGDQYGPIVVARELSSPLVGEEKGGGAPPSLPSPVKGEGVKHSLRGKKVAIPGTLTTAYLALKLYEKDFSYDIVPFDQILDYVKDGKADCGLVIHEGQLTYQAQGFHKILDLGEWWWNQTKLPLPLGVDVIRKNLGLEKMKLFSQVFKDSILYSLKHRKDALVYALPYGRGISEETGDQFVGMYVNDYTVDLGQNGEESIRLLLRRGYEQGILKEKVIPEFI